MGPKVVPSNCTYRDPHPSFYKGNHWVTASPSCLSSCHCPSLQYLMATPGGIIYWALKLSKPSWESTIQANPPIPKYDLEESKRSRGQKDMKKRKVENNI